MHRRGSLSAASQCFKQAKVIIDIRERLHVPALCRLACRLISELARPFHIAQGPEHQGQVNHGGGDLVLAEAKGEIAVAFAVEDSERLLDVYLGSRVVPEVKACQA